MSLTGFLRLLGTAAERWLKANVGELAAAIAFNTLLSLAPMFLLLLTVAAQLLGSDVAKGNVLTAIGILAGPSAAPTVETLVDMIVEGRGGVLATALGVILMVHFASAVFLQLRSALNQIWGVTPHESFRSAIRERLLSLVFVPAAVLAIMITMFIGLFGATASSFIVSVVPRGAPVWSLIHATVSFGLLTVLLAFLFRHGPRTDVQWRDVWPGAALTAFLFSAGNFVIGLFIGRSLLVSLYGAAGALVVVLLWVFYGAQILLFGAYFTRVYAERYGSRAGT